MSQHTRDEKGSTTGGPTRVMLVDDQPERAAELEKQLNAEGCSVVSVVTSATGLLLQMERHRPDIVLIDLQSPDRDVLESLAIANDHSPTPVAMFTAEDDPDYIRRAVEAGISTYFMQDVSPSRVKPIIDIAIAQFRTFQGLREELATTRAELENRSILDEAKRLLITRKRLSEDAAHQMLRRLAMNNNQSLTEVARTVVATLSDSSDGPNHD